MDEERQKTIRLHKDILYNIYIFKFICMLIYTHKKGERVEERSYLIQLKYTDAEREGVR